MSNEIQAERVRVVRPEILAGKLAAIANLDHPKLAEQIEQQPRLIEALCFLQWISAQPGGLAKLTEDLLAMFPQRLGTKAMRELGQRDYSLADCLLVFHDMPGAAQHHIEAKAGCSHPYDLWWRAPQEEMEQEKRENKEALEGYLRKFNAQTFRDHCRRVALQKLPARFADWCDQVDTPFDGLWCFDDVLGALFEFMDARAQQVGARLARTAVALKVFDALDYAHSERVLVRIEGDSRFGKTEAVQTWADMWPGRARVIRVPSSNSERDLHKAFAEALGIEHGFAAGGQAIRDKVEYVLRFLPLMMICDEAAFAIPQNYSRTTAPARLNWIRTAIVDRKIPCALIVTPQSYTAALGKFVRKTGYSVEQFIGREALIVSLPNELAWEDLMAVARIHFPGTDEDLLALVAAKAQQSESYLKAVENIARRARYLAGKRGAEEIELQDIDRAAAEALPARVTSTSAAPAAPVTPPAPKPAAKLPRRRSSAAAVLQAQFRTPENNFPARETMPLSAAPEGEPALATG